MSDFDYKLVTTVEELDALCEELSNAQIIAVDTETEGIEYADVIVGIALSHKPGMGRYIPIRHEAIDGIRYDNQLEPSVVYEKLGPILSSKPCTGHNVKFDTKMFWKDGVDVNYVHDTLIMAHILGVEVNGRRTLKMLVDGLLNHKMNDLDSLFPKIGSKKPQIRPKILSPQEIEFYGCEDGNWSLNLFSYLYRLLKTKPKLAQVYGIEMKLLRVVSEMESFGVPVSTDFLVANGKRADKYVIKLKEAILNDIRSQLGDPEYEINFKSSAQLGVLLFEHLGLPMLKYSQKTGAPSTDASVLQELAKQSPVVKSILTLRAIEKLNNTYLTGLQSSVDSDGRIRGSFNQVGTASGRFSSSKPNLQNLPKDQTFSLWEVDGVLALDVEEYYLGLDTPLLGRDTDDHELWVALNQEVGTWGDGYLGEFENREYGIKDGKLYEMWSCKTRDFISAPPDHYLIEADYSQVELRIMAGESQEFTLLDAYNEGRDVHTATAAVIFGIPVEHVTDKQRHVGKTVNFSLLYGAGPYNIAMQLGIEIEEAEDIVNKYFTNLPAVKAWINRVKEDTKMDCYADTIFGRRRIFHNVRGSDRKLAEKELRESVNHHIQGAAADIMKTALIRTSQQMRKHFGDAVKIISTVHDSLLLECHDSCDPKQVLTVLKSAMEGITLDKRQAEALRAGEVDSVTVVKGWPRLLIDANMGVSWGSAKKMKDVELRTPPPEIDLSTLPDVRVRKIALERESDAGEVKWCLEISRPLSNDRIDWLFNYLDSKKLESGSAVSLIYPTDDGTIIEKELSHQYDISFSDTTDFRIHLGPCSLKQEMEALDYAEVLRGVDFGLA